MLARIKFKKPEGTSEKEIAAFIADALSSWGGGLSPEDPLFVSLSIETVVVNGKTFTVKGEDLE